MANELLQASALRVTVEDKEILHGVDLTIGAGETHVLMGPNGAGKSTFGNALMGNPARAERQRAGKERAFHVVPEPD